MGHQKMCLINLLSLTILFYSSVRPLRTILFLYHIVGVVICAAGIGDWNLRSNNKHQQQNPIGINFPHGFAEKP